MTRELAAQVAERFVSVPGVPAVVLGGSVATRAADERSDIDLGLLYEAHHAPDLGALNAVAGDIDDRGSTDLLTDFDAWGPWVNGGGWLRVEGRPVDVIYRDVGRVRVAIEDCRSGRLTTHFQVGHPAGFTPQNYAGEIHHCEPLQDPVGVVAELKSLTSPYPLALRRALLASLRESKFVLDAAAVSIERGDVYHVAGSLFRAAACMVQALFGLNERYWINEKNALAAVREFRTAPPDFASRLETVLGHIGTDAEEVRASAQALERLLGQLRELCSGEAP